MGKLAGIATGRQVRKEVIDSRRILASLRQETGLDCTGLGNSVGLKRTDSRCILLAAMTGLSEGFRDVQGCTEGKEDSSHRATG